MARGIRILCAAWTLVLVMAVLGFSPAGAQELFPLKSGGKINIVFLAEAYVESQKQVFLNDADLAWKTIFDRTPFKENADKFSVHAIWVSSRDSILSEVPGRTYFGVQPNGSYWEGAIDSLTAVFFPMNRELTFPYLLVNDDISGSGGGLVNGFHTTIIGTGRLHHEVGYELFYRYACAHEFGHTFAGLADEYEGNRIMSLGGTFDEKEFPNITRETRREFIKWNKFIDPSTPIPTPDADQYNESMGLFDGSFVYQRGQGWYRPSRYCLMGNRNNIKDDRINRFCRVCQDAIEKNIQARLAIVVSAQKPTPDFNGDGQVDFSDFFLFANVFGEKTKSSNAQFDLDGDGEIGFGDFFIFANAFGK